jgi:hypothetical protein
MLELIPDDQGKKNLIDSAIALQSLKLKFATIECKIHHKCSWN